jgi:hypothetical protein
MHRRLHHLICLKFQLILLLQPPPLPEQVHLLLLPQILCSNNSTKETIVYSSNHPNMADLLL